MEQNTRNEPVAAEKVTRFTTPICIRVISYRKHRHDTDGCSVKAALDGLVRAGILLNDTSEQIKSITFESRKSKDERTEIIIDDMQ